ncbi:MAG: flagellar export chaperone FlgN [Deltaproteobacteria bacterium]|nr:flagellar export chaperone FlgN [Deltaproteobacteria bacterium]
MSLADAVNIAETLRSEIEVEVGRAREERVVLRSLDGQKIQARMEEKVAFQDRTEELLYRLQEAQKAAARELDLNDASAESLAKVRPEEGRALSNVILQIRALAATLAELTALNRDLAARALGCARAYLHAIAPRPTAYGRRGNSSAQVIPFESVQSRRA